MKKRVGDLKMLDMSLSLTDLMLLTRACVLGKMYLTSKERAGVNKLFAGLKNQLQRLGLTDRAIAQATEPMNLEKFKEEDT